jgi:N utilization substance protein A
VDDTQLSLAIGKKGQNVRLAAKLLAWKIDIKSEEEKRQEVEQQMQAMSGGPATPIEQVSELGEAIIQKLIAAGVTTVEGLADMTPEQLEEIPGIGEKTLEKIGTAVRHYFGQYEEGEERPAGATQSVARAAHIADVQAEEEIEALQQDLTQAGEDEVPREDGSGFIADEVAEEGLAEVTEEGEALEVEGAEALTPGREDTSETLLRHHPLSHAIHEGNVEEVKEEEVGERKVDEGGA